MKLSDVGTDNMTNPPRTVLHAVPGWGKTTLGTQLPSPIFVKFEEGLDLIARRVKEPVFRVPKSGIMKDWPEFQDVLKMLYAESTTFKSLVIDTMDAGMELLSQYVVTAFYGGDPQKAEAYGRWVKDAYDELRKVLKMLDVLNQKKGMNILILCHSKIDTFKNPRGEDFSRYIMKLPDSKNYSLNKLTGEWADNVLFGTFETSVENGKGVGSNRVIHTEWDPAYEAKNRYGMPGKMAVENLIQFTKENTQ